MKFPWNKVEERVRSDLGSKIEALESDLCDTEAERKELDSKVQGLESEVKELRQLVLETSPVQADLSDKERELAALWVQNPIWRTAEDVAEELDIGKSYAHNLLNGIRDKLDFEEQQISDNGKKAFRLEKAERRKITN